MVTTAARRQLRVYLIAGEASGDAIGANVLRALRRRCDDNKVELVVHGIGGPALRRAGLAKSLFPMEELSVMGIAEILPSIWRIRRRLEETVTSIQGSAPDVLLTVDSKGFAFRVHRRLHRDGDARLRRMHYVAPSTWAFKHQRRRATKGFHSLKAMLGHMFVLLPFEPGIFQVSPDSGWCSFVGHPAVENVLDRAGAFEKSAHVQAHAEPVQEETYISPQGLLSTYGWESSRSHRKVALFESHVRKAWAQVDREQVRARLGLPQEHVVLCVLLGSREQEVRRMSPIVLDALSLYQQQFPGKNISVVIPTVGSIADLVEDSLKAIRSMNVKVLVDLPSDERHELFVASDLAIATSGTVVTETALASLPTVVVYRAHPLTEWIAKRLTAVQFISLPNLLLGREVIPELVFDRCTPENIVQRLIDLKHRNKFAVKEDLMFALSSMAVWEEASFATNQSGFLRGSDIVAETMLQSVLKE